jgi:hypothetical protein
MFEVNERLEMARVNYDLTGYCPEKGRSHDSRPCCVCGKTARDDEREQAQSSGMGKSAC